MRIQLNLRISSHRGEVAQHPYCPYEHKKMQLFPWCFPFVSGYKNVVHVFLHCKALSLSARAIPLRVLGFVLAMKV